MFKKTLIAFAGIVLAGQSAFAQSANPLGQPSNNPLDPTPAAHNNPLAAAPKEQAPQTFIGEIQGMPVVLQVLITNGNAKGVLIVGTERCPLTGSAEGSTMAGTWVAGNGTKSDFKAILVDGQNKVRFDTNGQSVMLTHAGQTEKPAVDPQPRPEPQPVIEPKPQVEPPAKEKAGTRIEQTKGRFFNAPVPNGWRQQENQQGITVVSPDGIAVYGVVFANVDAQTTAEAFLKDSLQRLGAREPQILGSNVAQTDNSDTIEATVSFIGSDKVKRTGTFRAMVMKGQNGQALGMLVHAATASEDFEADGKTLGQLAMQIQPAAQGNQPQNRQTGVNQAPVVQTGGELIER